MYGHLFANLTQTTMSRLEMLTRLNGARTAISDPSNGILQSRRLPGRRDDQSICRLSPMSTVWPVSSFRPSISTFRRRPFSDLSTIAHGRRRHGKTIVPAVPEFVQTFGAALLAPHPGWAAGIGANTAVYLAGIRILLGGLTWEGVAHSWLLGSSVYAAFGLGGYVLVCLYFIFGSLATKVKLQQKKSEGLAEKRSGRRSIGSVWGSGLAGAVCALLSLATGNHDLYQIGFVASFGSKLSDTVSSEIGKAFGRRTFLATSLKQCPRGTEGAISIEGTAAGISAATIYALIAFVLNQISASEIWIVLTSCVFSNYVESLIGATVQGSLPWLTNDTVNGIQITLAATLAIFLKNHFIMV